MGTWFFLISRLRRLDLVVIHGDLPLALNESGWHLMRARFEAVVAHVGRQVNGLQTIDDFFRALPSLPWTEKRSTTEMPIAFETVVYLCSRREFVEHLNCGNVGSRVQR
jgi:hypothetical protein